MARNKTTIDAKYNAPFPTRLRKLMEASGETQDSLSKVAKKTRQTISQYVNGISEPGYDTLIKIAEHFRVSVDYLLGRTDTKSQSKDIQSICGVTGLSEKVVLRLIGWRSADNLEGSEIGADIIEEIKEHRYWMKMSPQKVIDFANCVLYSYLENPRWITRRYESYLAYLEAWRSIVSTQGEHPVHIAADDYSAELLDKGLVAISADLAAANCLSSAMSLLETSIDDNAKSDIGIVCD